MNRIRILLASAMVSVLVLASGLPIGRLQEVPVVPFSRVDSLIMNPGEVTWVMNFWATWCRPCVKELPEFEALERKYIDNPGIRVLLVSLDFPAKLTSDVLPFIEQRDIISEVWLLDDPDANKWIDRIDPSWSGAIPATLIFSKQGRIFHEGSLDLDDLDSLIHKINNPL